MKQKNMRTGSIYVNMLTGKTVTITELNDDRIVFDDGTAVRPEQMNCFKFIENTEPMPIPTGFSVIGEKLMHDGEKVEGGTIRFKEVVGAYSGGVLVTAYDKEGAGTELFAYDPEIDRFNKVIRSVSEIKKVYEDPENGLHVFLTRTDCEHVMPAEGDNEKKTVIGTEEAMFFCKNGVIFKSVHANTDYAAMFGEIVLTAQTRDDVTVLVMKTNQYLKPAVDEDGCDFLVEEKSPDKTFVHEFVIEQLDLPFDDEEDGFYYEIDRYQTEVRGEILDIRVVAGMNNSLLIINDKGITFTNNGYHKRCAMGPEVVETASMYPYLVDLKAGTHVNEFVLANDMYETVRIKVTKTHDRGYVTEICR